MRLKASIAMMASLFMGCPSSGGDEDAPAAIDRFDILFDDENENENGSSPPRPREREVELFSRSRS